MTEGLIKAFAHITGGGLADNIVRVLPPGIAAEIDAATWPMPAVFPWLQAQGNIAPEEMSRTFNCGLGAVVVVSPAHADKVLAHCAEKGEVVNRVGTIVAETPGAPHRVTVANLDTAFRGAAAPTPAPIALTPTRRVRTAVLISGSGTNLQVRFRLALVPLSRSLFLWPRCPIAVKGVRVVGRVTLLGCRLFWDFLSCFVSNDVSRAFVSSLEVQDSDCHVGVALPR